MTDMTVTSPPHAEGKAFIRYIPNTIVMQPHTICPLDCDYCDLALRRVDNRMSVEVARSVAKVTDQWIKEAEAAGRRQPDILWHASEPLALGVKHLASLYEQFSEEDTLHTLQTSGVHINQEWIDFFVQTNSGVGISIDGPEHMNRHRKLLGGQPAYARTMRGIELMHKAKLPFSSIAVVYDPNPEMVPELISFFANTVRPQVLGINIAETQGNKTTPDHDLDTVIRFWEAIFNEGMRHKLPIRDIERVMDYVGRLRDPDWDQPLYDPLSRDPYPAIRYDGNVVLISPELVDWTPDGREEWTSGNVLEKPLDRIIIDAADRRTTPWVDDFLTGVDACAATCAAFEICHGGQTSFRVFEEVPLTTSRTKTCTYDRIALLAGGMNAIGNQHRGA